MRIEPYSTNTENNVPPANARNSTGNSANSSKSSPQKLGVAQVEENKTSTGVKNQQLPVPQFPEDEVTVQFDKSMNDNILIYQFLDKQSGNLVLQVPSSQVLGVAHEIQNELQEQVSEERIAEQGAEENVIKRGGPAHGD